MQTNHKIDNIAFTYSPAKRGYFYGFVPEGECMIQELGFIPLDSVDTIMTFLKIIKEERA